jgi:hypothetical protein
MLAKYKVIYLKTKYKINSKIAANAKPPIVRASAFLEALVFIYH